MENIALLTERELEGLLEALTSEKKRRSRAEASEACEKLIDALEEFLQKCPNDTIEIRLLCEECDESITVDVTCYFEQIIGALNALK